MGGVDGARQWGMEGLVLAGGGGLGRRGRRGPALGDVVTGEVRSRHGRRGGRRFGALRRRRSAGSRSMVGGAPVRPRQRWSSGSRDPLPIWSTGASEHGGARGRGPVRSGSRPRRAAAVGGAGRTCGGSGLVETTAGWRAATSGSPCGMRGMGLAGKRGRGGWR